MVFGLGSEERRARWERQAEIPARVLGLIYARATVKSGAASANLMKPLLLSLVVIVLCAGRAAADQDISKLPPPPSVAMNPAPKPAGSEVRFLVDVIPAEAKYVVYAQMKMNGLTVEPSQVPQISAGISGSLDRMPDFARKNGANLIVLLSQQHGIPVPIRQADQPLMLKRENPVVTVIFFDWNPALVLSEKEKKIRFVTGPVLPAAVHAGDSHTVVSMHYTLVLKMNTASIDKSYWAYSNMSRFVKDAVDHGLDTVALRSSDDFLAQEVWLPASDSPIKVSMSKPVLDVTIFKRTAP